MTKLEKIFGKHSVRAVLLQRPGDIRRLMLAGKEDYYQEFIDWAAKLKVPVDFVKWPEFLRIGAFTEEDKHQGVCVFVEPRDIFGENDLDRLDDARCIIMLDQLSNPQNLATILRGAAFFHADAVITLRNRAVDFSPTVVRYAVGGAEFIRLFQVTNLSQALEGLKAKGFWAYGLDERGTQTLAQVTLPEKCIFVIGAEGEGLRPKTRQYCDALLRIPGGRDGVESLNAAVATTIALYEYYRLRD